MILFVAFAQVEYHSERHEPKLLLRQMQMRQCIIKQPGKQLAAVYPVTVFFESSSLWMSRAVPFCMASKIASCMAG